MDVKNKSFLSGSVNLSHTKHETSTRKKSPCFLPQTNNGFHCEGLWQTLTIKGDIKQQLLSPNRGILVTTKGFRNDWSFLMWAMTVPMILLRLLSQCCAHNAPRHQASCLHPILLQTSLLAIFCSIASNNTVLETHYCSDSSLAWRSLSKNYSVNS